MNSKRLELTGQRFGRLVVIGFSHTDKENAYWLCKCDCGKDTIVQRSSLRSGGTKSCGCLCKEITRKLGKQTLSKGIAARNKALSDHKISAKKRNIEQALTDEQIIALHKENCHYCGASPSNKAFQKNYNGSYTYNGIDRVDNNKGYLIDNVISCCTFCNHAKNKLSYDEFLGLIKRIHSHLKLKQF